jgi:hypothetical protein
VGGQTLLELKNGIKKAEVKKMLVKYYFAEKKTRWRKKAVKSTGDQIKFEGNKGSKNEPILNQSLT